MKADRQTDGDDLPFVQITHKNDSEYEQIRNLGLAQQQGAFKTAQGRP
jgi:hypothetical protein